MLNETMMKLNIDNADELNINNIISNTYTFLSQRTNQYDDIDSLNEIAEKLENLSPNQATRINTFMNSILGKISNVTKDDISETLNIAIDMIQTTNESIEQIADSEIQEEPTNDNGMGMSY